MPARRNRTARSLAKKSAELAFATPQVVAHRMARMAMSGMTPSARDRQEFQRMGAEKVAAFMESWNAMALQTFRANQAIAASAFRAFWTPWALFSPPSSRAAAQLQSAALGVLSKGLAPVHRKATANAKRLTRRKRR